VTVIASNAGVDAADRAVRAPGDHRLRVGVVGCGEIARAIHIPSYVASPRADLVAVADTSPAAVRRTAERFGVAHAFSNHREMLARVDLDAVSVCVPNKFHASIAIAALEAGCHVLCEKPPAVTVDEVARMVAAAELAARTLTFGFHHRCAPEVETLKRFCDANELGQIYAARATAVRRRGIPGWGVFTNKDLQGGGALMDIGSHVVDVALYLMNYPEPAVVLASAYHNIGQREGVGLLGDWDWQSNSVEDMAVGVVRFANGATLAVEASFAANIEPAERTQVSLFGDHGGADLYPLRIFQERHGALIDVTPVHLPEVDFHRLAIDRFVDCCLDGLPPISTPQEALILQRIVCALYESAETGGAVRLHGARAAETGRSRTSPARG
jgi:predicted dehydrogenase